MKRSRSVALPGKRRSCHHQGLRIGRVAAVGEQEHDRLDAGLLDRVGFGGHESLLGQRRLGEEWLNGETVRPLLGVGEPELLAQPRPERRVARGPDRDRLALEVLEASNARMRDDHRRILLERRGDRDHRHVLLDCRHDLQRVGHRDVDLAGGEQLQAVHLRPAHADRHVEAVLAVGPLGLRLVVPAVFRLGEPVGGEYDLLQRLRVRGHHAGQERQGQADPSLRVLHRHGLTRSGRVGAPDLRFASRIPGRDTAAQNRSFIMVAGSRLTPAPWRAAPRRLRAGTP